MKTSTLLLSALAFAMVACNGSNDNSVATGNQQGDPHEIQTNIRYVNRDSVLTHYIFAEATRQANQQIESELLAFENQLNGMVQNLQNQFQQKLQNNQFINESAAQAEYNKVQQQANGYQRQLQQRVEDGQARAAANTQALQDSINNFIIAFNAEKKYDAILFQDSQILQSQILYINPALDITKEVVDGLNARYTPVAADAKK